MNKEVITKKILPVIMILIVAFGFILLIVNEYLYAKANQPISNMKYRTISANKIDKKNNDKLIATTGELYATDKVTDEIFNISVNSPILERVVEVYTCHEICEPISYNKRKCKANSYWSTSLDSDTIYNSPICSTKVVSKKYQDLTMYNENIKLGAFKLDKSFLIKVPVENKVLELNEETAQKLNLYIVDSAYTTTPPNTQPIAGDIRITFYYAAPIEYTVLGKQTNNSIVPYIRPSGYSLSYASLEKLTGQQMLDTKKESIYYPPNSWKIRGISLLLIISGIIYPTIIFCSEHEKLSKIKWKMTFVSTSTLIIISMLIALMIWSLYHAYSSDDVILALIIAGSGLACLIGAILSKPLEIVYKYEDKNFLAEYEKITRENEWKNPNKTFQNNQTQVYTRRNSYENPYKTKTSSSKSYQRSQNNEESYKNPYK